MRGPRQRASLRPRTPPGVGPVVALGARVVLEDLDDGTCEEYVLVAAGESNPAEGRISSESPVGQAIGGHRRGDVVAARAPHRIRHLRIADLRAPTAGHDTRIPARA